MTINYIVNGFDKDFYNFDAVVVPVAEMIKDKSEQEVYGFRLQFLNDFRHDFREIMHGLPVSAFKLDRVTAVRSEKTGTERVRYVSEFFRLSRKYFSALTMCFFIVLTLTPSSSAASAYFLCST